MKLYNLYVRHQNGVSQRWTYVGTFDCAATVWEGAMRARNRGFITSIHDPEKFEPKGVLCGPLTSPRSHSP